MHSLAADVTAPASSACAAPRTPPVQPDIDLDANATTRPLDEVIDLVAAVMRGGAANPSSAHWLGAIARSVLEQARDGVASLLPGTLPEAVVFGSGGTEANNAVLAPPGRDAAGRTLITLAVEHPSVLRPAEAFARAGGTVVLLPVSPDGAADPDALGRAVRRAPGPVLVSVQWANSETGVLQPVGALAAEARRIRPDVFIHSDAAQAVGRVPVDLPTAVVDAVTFSGHKLHGPQGTGALVLRDPDDARLAPLLLGGGQERGLRSGTQNVAGAAGLGLAARRRAAAFGPITRRLAAMRDAFEAELLDRLPAARVNGGGGPRVPNTSSVRFPGIEGLALAARLDAQGLACSVGSACSSARPRPSPVLTAMGLSEAAAFSSLRFSFSILNTPDEAGRAARLVAAAAGDLA